MKTVSQLASGKKPIGTTAYLGRLEDLMHCHCDAQKGNNLISFFFLGFELSLHHKWLKVSRWEVRV